MTVVAFVTSTLTSRKKENAERALEKERETQALYRLTSRLTEAKELSDAAETAVVIISDLLGCQAACLCYDEKGSPEKTFLQRTEEGTLVIKKLEGEEELKKRLGQLHTSFAVGPEFYDWPVYGGQGILGVVRIPAEKAADLMMPLGGFHHSMAGVCGSGHGSDTGGQGAGSLPAADAAGKVPGESAPGNIP